MQKGNAVFTFVSPQAESLILWRLSEIPSSTRSSRTRSLAAKGEAHLTNLTPPEPLKKTARHSVAFWYESQAGEILRSDINNLTRDGARNAAALLKRDGILRVQTKIVGKEEYKYEVTHDVLPAWWRDVPGEKKWTEKQRLKMANDAANSARIVVWPSQMTSSVIASVEVAEEAA